MTQANPQASVVPTQADRELRDQINDLEWPGNHAAYDDALDQIIARHRLAHQTPPATQPSATVGEVEAAYLQGQVEMRERAAELCDERGGEEQQGYGLDRAAQNYYRARNAIRGLQPATPTPPAGDQ